MPTSREPVVEIAGLVKRYGAVTALAGVDLRIEPGTVHGLLGRNGAGKTTLLRVLFGLVRPDAGTVRVLGAEVHGHRAPRTVAGFVDSPRFYPYLSAQQNLDLLAGLDGHRSDPDRVDAVLDRVGLAGRTTDRVAGFSYGMRQRLGIAAALLRDPRLLILDEPTNGLDPAGIKEMRALVRALAADDRTVLISSHHMDEVEQVCDRVTILRAGTVAFDGDLGTLRGRAPEPAHRLRTSDDDGARRAASGRPDVELAGGGGDGDGDLTVRAGVAALDAYVLELAKTGIAVRELAPTGTPLEELFLAVTA